MGDPLSQFSMLGSGFNSQLVQNPNAAGASQQQQPSGSMQPIGGLPNPEHSRMWMQLQQQINQQRTTSAGDIVGSQMVGQQQLQRPTFSAGSGPSMQHNMLSQFQNNGVINQMTTPQLHAAFQQNRSTPAMLANMQPTQARQLELMMAQHHPSHGNQANGLVPSRLNSSQPVQQGFPQGMIGGTPNAGQPSQVNPATAAQMLNGTTPQEARRAALQELREKALHLHANIKAIEQQQAAFAGQRSMMGEAMFLQKMAIAEQDIARKRAILTKWNMMLSANGMPPIGQGIGQMNPPGPSSQPGVIPTQNTQGQPTWIPGTQQNPALGFSTQASPPPGVQQAMGGHMNVQQHNFSQGPPQNPGGAMTPPQSQPNQTGILAPPSTLQSFTGTSVPPLDRGRFQGSYRHFCTTKKLAINEAALNISGKPVDLHALHEEVLKLRATDRRLAPNFWHIIGSKLGFPFSEEQASSEVAVQVATIYKQFLHQFDTIYVASFLQESQKRNAMNPQQGQPQTQNTSMPPRPPSSTGPNSTVINQQPQPQRNPNAPQHPLQQVSQGPLMGFPGNPPYQFNQMIPYAYITAAELRMRGINEQFIAHVEEKRPHLQRFIEQHQEMKRRQSIGGAAGTINNTPGLGMGLNGLPGTQAQQTHLQPQMVLSAAQQMNPNLRPGVPPGLQGQTSRPNEGAGIGLSNGQVTGVTDGIQRSQIPQPPQMPTQSSLANAIPNPNVLRGRPSQERINNAAMFVQRTKKEYMTRSMAAMRFTNVPEDQRQEYSTVFDNLWRFVIEVDPKMTMYAVLLPEDLVRRLIAMVLTCQQQRSLLSSNPPRFLLELPSLKMMTGQVQECILMFNRALADMNGGNLSQQHLTHPLQIQPQPQPPQYQAQPPHHLPQATPQPLPQPQHPTIQQQITPPSESSPRTQAIPPNLHSRVPSLGNGTSPGSTKPHTPPAAVNKTPSLPHATPSRVANKQTPASSENTPAMPAASPPQSIPTPATSTLADAASPTTTKSPKSKPRPKATKRKPSTKGLTQETGNLTSPAPEQPMAISTPAPPTPVASVQTPGSDGSAKRRREDEELPQTQNEPSLKKVKTEWEPRDNEAALKRNEEVESVKTDDEASKLLEEVVGLITQAQTVDGQASMASDISDSLDQILKQYTAGSDLPSVGDLSDPSHVDHRPNNASASSNDAMAISDEFGDFFDFSSYDTFSKATTPDLVPASSTNTSPESASDGPAHTPLAVDTGFGDDGLNGGSDIRKLGFWTEIDGGEGVLYQQDNWKWSGQMPTMDPAWAISTTTL